jgi:hypothetical protein
MFYESIPKLNSHCVDNKVIGHISNHDGMYASKLFFQH